LITVVAATTVSCAAAGGEAPARGNRQKIVDGAEHVGDPATVVLGGPGHCTGSLIAPRVVLTARHCVESNGPNSDPVEASTMTASTTDAQQKRSATRGVAEIMTTASRGYPQRDGDIALLVLNGDLPVEPYRWVNDDPRPARGTTITVIGYGATSLAAADSGPKRRGSAKLLSVEDGTFITTTVACYGDSGGPAFLPDGRVWGVVSGAVDEAGELQVGADCTKNLVGFVRTDAHRALIEEAMERAATAPGGTSAPAPTPETAESPCGATRDAGIACDGSVLTWCDELGDAYTSDCAAEGLECALDRCVSGLWCCERAQPSATPGCDDVCLYALDGECDDGGPGAFTAACAPGTDCTDCGPRGAATPADATCTNGCAFGADGICDDGGPGAITADCAYGDDCIDCGPR
jgi:V8-like Glu-specific endopeptidase